MRVETGRYPPPTGPESAADPGMSRKPAGPGERGPSRWLVIFVVLLLCGALGTLAWVLLGSRLVVVRHVEVSGTTLLSRGQVLTAGRLPLGTPMARLDVAAVRHRIEGLRQVESAQVRREWPGTVRIEVTERVPVVMAVRGGGFAEIDKYGVTVLIVHVRPRGLPELEVAGSDPADPAARAALASWRSLPASFTRRVAAVSAASGESVTFRLNGGRTVVWGAPERGPEKLRLLEVLERSVAGRSAHTIDVSSPEMVTTR